jgi:hypothetical protein
MNKEFTTPTITVKVTHHTVHAEILVDYGYLQRLIRVLYPYESTDQGRIGLGSIFHGTTESVVNNAIRAELGDKTYTLQ